MLVLSKCHIFHCHKHIPCRHGGRIIVADLLKEMNFEQHLCLLGETTSKAVAWIYIYIINTNNSHRSAIPQTSKSNRFSGNTFYRDVRNRIGLVHLYVYVKAENLWNEESHVCLFDQDDEDEGPAEEKSTTSEEGKRRPVRSRRMQEYMQQQDKTVPIKQRKCTHPGCEKLFSSGPGLRYHLRTHSPTARFFVCDHCSKEFKRWGMYNCIISVTPADF